MGHIGTLDPLATGLLLIATEWSTKLLPYIDIQYKRYSFRVHLDGTSESLDTETEIIAVDTAHKKNIPSWELKEFIQSITTQIPPKYSALMIDGKRAYKLARKWREFSVPSRPIEVKDVEIGQITENTIDITLSISNGGYIRSFAPVIAEYFWIHGWYVSHIQRIALLWNNIHITNKDAVTIEHFNIEKYISLESLFPEYGVYMSANTSLKEDVKNWKEIPLHIITNDIVSTTTQQQEILLQQQRIFIDFWDYTSLLEKNWEVYRVLKNDVYSSQKTHTIAFAN